MRIQVLHDSVGNISSILAPVEGSRKGGLESPSPDMSVIEVDSPEVALPADVGQHDGVATTLSHLMQHYKVQNGRLVERAGKAQRLIFEAAVKREHSST